ncbi:hypothetical protein RHGRI_030526 [Rhododendron griersonianum]|uniref:Uncharacterized protein n=1 Tax=Rhododendron griersonianum TaxID=479676 RepID=A0AAV6INJ3_9ERIC|nr:hypothetical protein RHGRI_030526 [Rhododendron griersonianum]
MGDLSSVLEVLKVIVVLPCVCLVYGLKAFIHPFFVELHGLILVSLMAVLVPSLFSFKPQELKGASLELLAKLLLEHARKQCPFLGLWGI